MRAPPGQPSISSWLKKVQFKIYHTYSNPSRLVDGPGPFEIEETGWGGFNIEIRLFFAPEVGSKPEYRSHFLQLEPYGSEELQKRQAEEGMVRSEFLEYVEFNEPTEGLWEVLTDGEQWPKAGARGGKGKNKRVSGAGLGVEGEGSVELVEKTTKENPFSKQLEQQILAVLRKAEKDIDDELVATTKEREGIQNQMKALHSSG